MFEDGQTYNASVYDMSENYTAKVMVVTNSQINAAADSSIASVKYIVKATNNDDEQTDMLVALVDGKEVSIYADVYKRQYLESGSIPQYFKSACPTRLLKIPTKKFSSVILGF